MPPIWQRELWKLGGLLLLLIVIALLTRSWSFSILLVLGSYIGWNLRQLYKVQSWLAEGGKPKLSPESSGIWDELIQQLYKSQQTNRLRKKRLAKLVKRFHKSLEAIPDATVLLGNLCEIEWANSAAARLLGIRIPQDYGQRIDNLIRDPAFHYYIRRLDLGGNVEIPSPSLAGAELNIRIVPFGEGHLLTAHDISDYNRMQRARRNFVANVSHELRTPLTVITGYVETLQGDSLPDHTLRGLKSISRQSARMQAIVSDLLTLSQLEMKPLGSGRRVEQIPVPELLASLRSDALQLSDQRQHQITLAQVDPIDLRGNSSEISSVFSNLLYNAVHYTPENGQIVLRWQQEGDGVRFSVQDNGPGIEAHHLPLLTERFYRVDAGRSRDKGGTGLGLSIVKHILARYGTTLQIESQRGVGSTFSCYFPPEHLTQREPGYDKQAS